MRKNDLRSDDFDPHESKEYLIISLREQFLNKYYRLWRNKNQQVSIRNLKKISANRFKTEAEQNLAYTRLAQDFGFDEKASETENTLQLTKDFVYYFANDFFKTVVLSLTDKQMKKYFFELDERKEKIFDPVKNKLLLFFTALGSNSALACLIKDNSSMIKGVFMKQSSKHVKNEVMDVITHYWALLREISKTFKYYFPQKPMGWFIKCIKTELFKKNYIIEINPNSSQIDESTEDPIEINENINVRKNGFGRQNPDSIAFWQLIGEEFFRIILLDTNYGYVWKRLNYVLKLFDFKPSDVLIDYHDKTIADIVEKIKEWLSDILSLDDDELKILFEVIEVEIHKTIPDTVPIKDHKTWKTLKEFQNSSIPIKDLRLTLFVQDENPTILSGWNARLAKRLKKFLKNSGYDINDF